MRLPVLILKFVVLRVLHLLRCHVIHRAIDVITPLAVNIINKLVLCDDM